MAVSKAEVEHWFSSNKKPPNEVQASCADSSQSSSLYNPIPRDNVSSAVPVPAVCDLDSSNEPTEIMSCVLGPGITKFLATPLTINTILAWVKIQKAST